MIYLEHDTNGTITLRHYLPFDKVHGYGKTQEELEQTGIFVESIPEPNSLEGKMSILQINLDTNSLYYTYEDAPESPEEIPLPPENVYSVIQGEVKELQHNQKTANQKFSELDKEETPLSDFKKAKMAQLDELCNLSIVNGFKHTVGETEYLFSCSLSAQANFTGTDLLFKDGFIADAQWSAVNVITGKVERVTLTKTEFNTVKLRLFQHINSNISQFRNVLQAQVESALTNDEVDSVKWHA